MVLSVRRCTLLVIGILCVTYVVAQELHDGKLSQSHTEINQSEQAGAKITNDYIGLYQKYISQARGSECPMYPSCSNYGLKAFNELVKNLKVDTSTCAPYVINEKESYKGYYIGNVPRGMLSHWVRIEEGKVANYQAVVPSTWNAGPRDANGQKGPYEASLIGIKIANLAQPLEIIRTIHSFDPCIACSVHLIDTKGNKMGEYKMNPATFRV